MELLIAVLLWIGAIAPEQTGTLTHSEAFEIFGTRAQQIEMEYPEEYGIIMTDENEVN